ncbi:MAG: hypothetical protein ACRDTA_24285 [Pseudonocardiaceae bacterium]
MSSPSWHPFGVEMAGEVLLPGPGAQLAPITFDTWLAALDEHPLNSPISGSGRR